MAGRAWSVRGRKRPSVVALPWPDSWSRYRAPSSKNQHRIAKAVKTIARPNRLLVRTANQLLPREGAHQDHQCGAGQVKIRDEGVDEAEAMTGLDEETRPAFPLRERLATCRCAFQGPHRCRAYRDHAATPRAGCCDGSPRLRGNLGPLRV